MRSALRRWLNGVFGGLFGLKLYSVRAHGRDDVSDIQKTGKEISTIFDIGSHEGQSAVKFREAFPLATIHCFEPASIQYGNLIRRLSCDKRVTCYRVAVGSVPGLAEIFLTENSTMCSLIRPEYYQGTESVAMTTVDKFCSENGVRRIDLLKIDAEGFDLEVLRGAADVLSSGRVSFVLAEVGFNRDDQRHVLFDEVRDFLADRGFRLYGIYDQQLEWSGENRIRYANACFLREV